MVCVKSTKIQKVVLLPRVKLGYLSQIESMLKHDLLCSFLRCSKGESSLRDLIYNLDLSVRFEKCIHLRFSFITAIYVTFLI